MMAMGEKAQALDIYNKLLAMDPGNPKYEEMARKLKPEPKVEPKPVPMPQPKVEPKPEPKQEPKPVEPTPEPKLDEMAVLDATLKKNPKDSATILKKAQLHEQRGESDMAVRNYQRLLALEPENLDYIDMVLKFKPDDVNLLTTKGDKAYEKEDFKRALEAFDKLSMLQPAD
jgi:tetratricopeptide (TPR) repeat protein